MAPSGVEQVRIVDMSREVIIYSRTLDTKAQTALAQQYGATYGLNSAVSGAVPPLVRQSDWQDLVKDSGETAETVVRYWHAQTRTLSKMLNEAYPVPDGAQASKHTLSVLSNAWENIPGRTVVFERHMADHVMAIVFPGMVLDTKGGLNVEGAPMPMPPHSVVAAPLAVLAEGTDGSAVQQAIWTIMKYIGEGLSEIDPPFVGTIFSVLLDFLEAFSETSAQQMQQLLSDIKEMLQEDRIQIEMDTANSTILTWSEYEGSHFQQADLELLNHPNPNKSSQAYKDAESRISDFVTKINGDFNGTPRLFDAVNLMRGDTSQNASSLDFPTDAMLKFSYFMFYASFVLALGKQAWMASKALNGDDAAVTQSLKHQVAYLSKDYTAYVTELAASINAQVSTRIGRWIVSDENLIDAHTFIIIQDVTWDRTSRYYPPKEWNFQGSTVFSYCGNSQRRSALQAGNAAKGELILCYQNYMFGRIVKVASDGRSLEQEFAARVAAFQENDRKYQNLAING